MITIENKEIRTSRRACTKVVEKMCLNRKEMHNPRRNNMLAPEMTQERAELCKQYQTTLMLAELIITGEMQRYAARMKQYLQEHGLYRQRAKRSMGELMGACTRMQSDFLVYERYTSMQSITQSFPIYINDYMAEGENVSMKVQQAYTQSTSDKIQLMFFGYKNFFDRHRLEHSELVAAAYTAMELSLMGRDVSKTIHALIDNAVYGYVTNQMPPLRILNKIETALREVLSEVTGDKEMECDTEEFKSIRQPLQGISTALVDGKPVMDMLNAVAEHTFRYMDYCMVRLWLAAHEGLNDKVRGELEALGTDADALMAQLRALPLPEYEDVWDLQEQLPKGEDIDDTPMYDFYLRCCDRVPYITDLNNMEKDTLN